MANSKPRWRVDIIVSICAMLVSMATFGIYLYQTKIIHEQAKASVYPHLEVVRQYNNKNEPFIIFVKNVGIGPAFLKKMEIKYKNQVYSSTSLENSGTCLPFRFLTKILPFEKIPTVGNGPNLPIVIPAGEEVMFLRLNEDNPKSIQLLVDIFDNARIKICYSSVYKDYWTTEKWKQPEECKNCENENLFKPTKK
ncbi:MAG: hypothetical protein U5N85_03650 [Arcicella sp.]|nr:hypothetical protein [Arcicella sp.]